MPRQFLRPPARPPALDTRHSKGTLNLEERMMMRKIDRRAPSLLELLRRARLAEQARRGEAVEHEESRAGSQTEIVAPRDERGTPYPGDFPNHLGGSYRGCF